MSEKFELCPFCGSSNATLDYYEISGPQELGTIVVCNDCGASAKSIVDWNTRPIEDALTARAEAAEQKLSELQAEIERLRAALSKYANPKSWIMGIQYDNMGPVYVYVDGWLDSEGNTDGPDIAVNALKGGAG